ncbi:hypothetical protein ABH15_10955 [Methanoculleus taiwanensis]|uniref:Polysaccharide deacetylase n=2 Tax=Methanoculleus taiwanensis TaxID=1550565 RepID=A0A498GZN3_9EURY|nr:hypothetical protein ABH15_10955 [Methanoculleus taiwanensis]
MLELLREDPAIWDLFTRKEEYAPGLRDEFDRFPYYLSSHRNIFKPCVSEYLHDRGYRVEYPDGQPFAICLTHDIDSIYRPSLFKGYDALQSLKVGNLRKGIDSISQIRSKKLPWCNFQEIMALEEQYDATSSFYFLALAPGDKDYRYDIRDLETDIGTIADAGWEVGLHGGHQAYCDLQQLQAEKKRLEKVLNRPVIGYRNHYLRFRVPETWKHLAEAGFRYDTTLGYPDCVGFRNGMCHPFRPYDLTAGREIDIMEIPLTIMDTTLDRYMRLDPGRAWEVTRCLIDATERCGGVATILWHNTFMGGERLKLYEKALRYCGEKGAWMTSGVEIQASIGERQLL